MSKKQDRTYVRKPSDLEQKYAFGKNFNEARQLISAAQRAASEALAAAESINAKFEEITVIKNKLKLIEAQSAYTAMMTDTLLEKQGMKEKIASWYGSGLWTAAMVDSAVTKGVLTAAEATEIKG